MKTSQIVVLLVVLTMLPSTAFAAGNGSSPKGKPFVAINDQIVEIEGAVSSQQDQIDLLVDRVDTVEQRVTANEDAVSTLQNQNAALEVIVQQNLSDIAAIEAEIVSLQQANTDLQAMIATNSGDIMTLQADVAANDALIASLQSAILLVQNDIIDLGTSLQAQIDNNVDLIAALQSEINLINDKLSLKQNLVNGTCPDGSAVQQILTDGSVICEGVGGSSGQLQSTYSYQYSGYISPGYYTSINAFCPPGYTATGSGVWGANGWSIDVMNAGYYYQNASYLRAFNNKSYSDYLYAFATCVKIVP